MSLRAGEVRRTRTLQSGYRGAGDDFSADSPFYGFIPRLSPFFATEGGLRPLGRYLIL